MLEHALTPKDKAILEAQIQAKSKSLTTYELLKLGLIEESRKTLSEQIDLLKQIRES